MKTLGTIMAIGALFTLGMVPPGQAAPGPGGCDERFQSGDPLLKFCQGLNAGIGGAEIHIKSLAMMVENAQGKCDIYRLSRRDGGTSWFEYSASSTNEKCTSAFPTFDQLPPKKADLETPFYLSEDRYKEFFEKLAWKMEQGRDPDSTALPDKADLMIVADYRSKSTDTLPTPIVIATSYHTAANGRIFKKLRSGYLCPDPVDPRVASKCKVSSETANIIGPFHANPNGWDSYKILSGYGSDRLVRVTYKYEDAGGTPILFPKEEYCRPDSYYVQSARAHFNLEKHPHPPHNNSVTVDFCACSHYDSDGLCLAN